MHNNIAMKSYIFRIVIEEERDGRFSAFAPSLPGCNTWGESKEEALKNIEEAIHLYVEDLMASGEDVPSDEEIDTPAVAVNI